MKILPPFSMLLTIAWRNYVRRFDVVLFANLIIALPLNILLDITSPRHLYSSEAIASANDLPTIINAFSQLLYDPLYVTNLFVQIIASVLTVYITITLVIMLRQIYNRKPWPTGVILQQAVKYLPAAIAATLLVRLIIGLGLVFFIIPGLILALILSLTIPALVWHNLNPWQAMLRSYQAVRKNWWAALAYLIFVSFLVSGVMLLVVLAVPDVLGFKTLSLTISSIISSFAPLFSVILFAALDLDFSEEKVNEAPTP